MSSLKPSPIRCKFFSLIAFYRAFNHSLQPRIHTPKPVALRRIGLVLVLKKFHRTEPAPANIFKSRTGPGLSICRNLGPSRIERFSGLAVREYLPLFNYAICLYYLCCRKISDMNFRIFIC